MQEAKINKEIKEIKERVVFSLSLRQLIFSAIAIVVAVGAYFLFRDYLDMEILTWTIIILAAPFAILGFVTFQGMPAEKIALELIQSYLINKKTIENKPRNTYKLMISVMDDDTDQARKQRKKKAVKNSVIVVIITVVLITMLVVLAQLSSERTLQNHISSTIAELTESYDSSYYPPDQWKSLKPILTDMKSEISIQKDIDSVESCKKRYIKKLNQIKTFGQIEADNFESFYGDNKTIQAHSELSKIYQEEYEKIKALKSAEESAEAYESAIERINEEIRSYNYIL